MVDFVERNPKKSQKPGAPKPPPAAGRPKPRKIHEDDLQVKCPGCGRSFGVLTALAGAEAVCPGCSKPVPVPSSKGSSESATGLKKPSATPQRSKPKPVAGPGEKKAKPAEGSDVAKPKPSTRKVRAKANLKMQPKCPECEAVLEPDAVLCVKCGYDLRKKTQNVTTRTSKLNPVIPIVMLALLLGGTYAVYEFVIKPKDGDSTTTSTTTQPVAQEPDPDPVDEPTLVDEPVAEIETEPVVEAEPEPVVDVEPEPVVDVEPEVVVEATPEPEPEPMPEPEPEPVVEAAPEPVVEAAPEPVVEEPVVVEAEPEPVVEEPGGVEEPVDPREKIRLLMAGKLDTQYPFAKVGETVSLTALDGTEYAGTLTSMEGGTIRIQQDGEDVFIQMKNLKRRSRTRLDTAYRQSMIDQLTDRYFARKAAAN